MGTRKRMPALRAIAMVIWKISKIERRKHIRWIEDSDGYEDDEPDVQRFEGVTRLCFDLVIFDGAAHVLRFAHTSVQITLSTTT